MACKMEQIKVDSTDNGMILISQEYQGEEDADKIVISPDQVDVLCQWLREERDKLKAKKQS